MKLLNRPHAEGWSNRAREIADYLGHERVSMPHDVYMARKSRQVGCGGVGEDAAPPLSRTVGESWGPIFVRISPAPLTCGCAPPAGFEPATPALGGLATVRTGL